MWLGMLAVLVAFSYAVCGTSRRDCSMTSSGSASGCKRSRASCRYRVLSAVRCSRSWTSRADSRRTCSAACVDLPSTLTGELPECVNRNPIPEPDGVRTAHDLHLADKVTEALTNLSILVVEFSDDDADGAHTVLAGELVMKLTALELRFTGPEVRHGAPEGDPKVLTTAFDESPSSTRSM